MTYGNPDRQSIPAPRTLYLLGQSRDTPAEHSTNWVVLTAEDEITNWDSNTKLKDKEKHESWK